MTSHKRIQIKENQLSYIRINKTERHNSGLKKKMIFKLQCATSL